MQQNLGFFAVFWSVIWCWIQNSQTYRILRGVYDRISGSWRESRIAGWFRQDRFPRGLHQKSLAGRILGSPFALLELLQKRLGAKLRDALGQSVLVGLGTSYLHNFLALNLRFLGYLLAGMGAGVFLGLFGKGTIDWGWLVLALLGRLLALLDANGTDWLQGSYLVSFVCKCLGIRTEFSWYEADKTTGKTRLYLGLAVGLLFGVMGGLTMPILGVAIPVALFGLLLVLAKPIAGLFALVFLAPLAPTMAMAGLSLLTLGSLIIKSIIDPEFRWRYDGLGFLLLAFVMIYLFAALSSFAMAKSLSIWAIYAAFIAAYFLIINLIHNPIQLRNLLVTFVVSGLLVCLYGICQYLFGWDTAQAWMDEEMFSDIKMRIYSTLENPNVLGEYILLVLPVAIGMFWTGKGVLQKLTYAGISAVLFGALILTFSRGCWVGLLVAAAVFVTFAAGKLWGLGLIALPIIPAILPESIINRFTSIGDMKDSSTSYRVYIWMGTLAMIRDFWVSGIGMGAEAFTAVYPFYSYNGVVAPHSHNLFLQILVESGIVGIAVFGLILLFFLKRMATGYQLGGGKGAPLSTMITAISAGVCGFLVQGMFDNCFYNYRVMLIFWLVLGLGMAYEKVAREAGR
ncbi:MAG: O-antigen ligase family protein [Clostridia bacterium]|nr:O-antigen ligase family protein [Clostridia bacterium]